jgi:cysteinyl-tRNA synthetase
MSDILRRYLEFKGYQVKFVMNLTDVDDRIIKKSIDEKKSASEISEFYSDRFFEDIAKLNIKPASEFPKATQHISDMINMISDLEKKGYAYNVDGNVFFNVSRFTEYGKLSGKNIDELIAGARIEVNETKKDPLDFALWKKAKEGEPSWDSPWGKGRPGWHIECSAMSIKHLGKTIDIHAGGNDLIFPHHENEIAQSEAACDKKFVKYWVHFGFLNIQSEKMSKSLGNFFTAREVLNKYSAESIRLFFAQTHYGGPLNFSDELLQSSAKGVEKISNLYELLQQKSEKDNVDSNSINFDISKYNERFINAMDDDFSTPQAVAVIFDFVRDVNKIIAENEILNKSFYYHANEFLVKTAVNVFGILQVDNAKKEIGNTIDNKLINILLNIRTQLKNEKNFELADMIRNELNSLGIELKDGKDGTTFKWK